MVSFRRNARDRLAYLAAGGLGLAQAGSALAQGQPQTFNGSAYCQKPSYEDYFTEPFVAGLLQCRISGNLVANSAEKEPEDTQPKSKYRVPWVVVWRDILEWISHAVSDPISLFTMALVFFTWRLQVSTEKLWIAGREALQTTERAFVFFDGFEFDITSWADVPHKGDHNFLEDERFEGRESLYITRFAIRPKWRNSGSTPTKGMNISVDWNQPGTSPNFKYRRPSRAFFIGAGSTERSDTFELPGARAIVEHGLGDFGEPPLILIWGRADYFDVFGKAHFVEWCHRLHLDAVHGENLRGSSVQWGDYNRTDET